MKKYWITKNGEEIKYKNIPDDHLLNILRYVKRRANEMDGEIIDGGGFDVDDIWYIEGDESDWLKKFDYQGLLKEARKRRLV